MTTAPAPRPELAPRHGPLGSLRLIASDIKLAHSVFALPFALLAAFMAAAPSDGLLDWRGFGQQLILIILAMIFARTVAMLANRWLDRKIDAANPRTASRALPSGRLSSRAAIIAIAAAAGAFVLVCLGFGVLFGNWWPSALSVPVLGWISAYGLLKRYTALCHIYLGSSLALSPLAAAIAIDPVALTEQPALWLICGMVLGWVAGFDIIYALQDVEVDRAQGLHSIPARLGVSRGLLVSRVLHAFAAGSLALAGWLDPRFGLIFGSAVALVAALLILEHATVHTWGTSRLALAFGTLNGVISCALGALGIIDILV